MNLYCREFYHPSVASWWVPPGPGIHPLALTEQIRSLDFQTSLALPLGVSRGHLGTPSHQSLHLLPALERIQTYVNDNTVKSNDSPRTPKPSRLPSALPLAVRRGVPEQTCLPGPRSSPGSCSPVSAYSSCFGKGWTFRYQPLPRLRRG